MSRLAGVFAANVTPFDPASLAIDQGWMQRHLAYLRARGCNGIVPLGTNGEGPAMSVAERQAVIDTALGAADGLAVVPGTGCASLPDTVALTRYALQAGADAVLVIPPFFFKNVSDAGVLAYYQRLCDSALQPGQQILLYHFPQLSMVPIGDAVVAGLRASQLREHRPLEQALSRAAGLRRQRLAGQQGHSRRRGRYHYRRWQPGS